MIALEVQLNGQRLCLAGAEDLSVLNAGVVWSDFWRPNTTREYLRLVTAPRVSAPISICRSAASPIVGLA